MEDFNCSQDESLCDQTSGHLVMFDAGSTGTRVHIYYYEPRIVQAAQLVATPLSFPKKLASFSTRPGISAFSTDSDASAGIAASLKPLIQSAAAALHLHKPHLDLSHVPVYLGATAGVRNLTEQAQHNVMRGVRKFLRSSDNYFAFRHDAQARILSGEEEGTFAWLGLNYFTSSIEWSAESTWGSLDFGGDSMQIAFVPQDSSILANFFPLHFSTTAGLPIHLYTHSFLQHGKAAAFERATKVLVREDDSDDSKPVVLHPCMPKGLSWHVDPGEFGVSTQAVAPERESGQIELRGSGNFTECEALATKLIIEAPCLQPPCSFAGVYQPLLRESRFVIIGKYDVFTKWQVVPLWESGVPLLKALKRMMNRICALPLHEQRELFADMGLRKEGNGVPPCWMGTWMYTMLHKGLKFPEDSRQLYLKQGCCDSAAGRAIYEINFFPYQMRLSKHRTSDVEPVPKSFAAVSCLLAPLAGGSASDDEECERVLPAVLSLIVGFVAGACGVLVFFLPGFPTIAHRVKAIAGGSLVNGRNLFHQLSSSTERRRAAASEPLLGDSRL